MVGQGNEMVYQLKVTLKESKPLIWRRFRVSGNVTFYRLQRLFKKEGVF